jgi:hypothetical protein
MPLIRSCAVATVIIFLINPAARAQSLTTLQACISQNVQNNTLTLTNIQQVYGGNASGHGKISGSVWGICCGGDLAKKIYGLN